MGGIVANGRGETVYGNMITGQQVNLICVNPELKIISEFSSAGGNIYRSADNFLKFFWKIPGHFWKFIEKSPGNFPLARVILFFISRSWLVFCVTNIRVSHFFAV